MKRMKMLLLLIAPALLLTSSCSLDGNSSAAAEVSYGSKEVKIYSYLDAEKSVLELTEDLYYDGSGELSAKDVYFYEEQSDGNYLNTKIENYDYADGAPVLFGKVEYEYIQDYYNLGATYDWIASKETVYTYSGGAYTLDNSTEVCFDDQACGAPDADTSAFANYTSYIEFDSAGSPTATQTCSWITLGDGYQYYQSERYYDGAEDGANLIEEYVCHYDDSTYDYLYEMCHFVNEGEADDYFYTLYSRNVNGRVYEQADYDYAVVPATDVDAVYGMFIDTDLFDSNDMTQNILLENIGDKQTVVSSEYDPFGNRVKKTMSSQGQIISFTNYAYNDEGNLIDTSLYNDGGDYLSERETIAYSEKYDDNNNYLRIETICFYEFGDSARSTGRVPISNGGVNNLLAYRSHKLKENHRM